MQAMLLLLMFSGVFSADLPAAAKREMDIYTSAVAKADAVRQVAVDKAVDAAVKALDAVSRKAATAEDRRAIDDQIIEIKKARSKSDDLLGDGKKENPWVGRFFKQDGSVWAELGADGTAKLLPPFSRAGVWVNEGDKVVIRWTGTDWVDTVERGKGDTYLASNKSGSWTVTKEKR